MFLLFGGKNDFNIQAFAKQLRAKQVEHQSIIIEEDNIPSIHWDLNKDKLLINDKFINPSSIFLRDDVFGSVTSNPSSSYSWYTTLRSWALSHYRTSMFNKHYIGMNKSYNLVLAQSVGFDIPKTIITNDTDQLSAIKKKQNYIIKPVSGGQYTRDLTNYLNTAIPAKKNHTSLTYLQNKLIQPEMRIFGIGELFYGFWIKSNLLDYRQDKKAQIIACKAPLDLSRKLSRLMKELKLDFVAADFKTCPQTNKLLFLEVNSGPMFGSFDYYSRGALTKAMISWHLKRAKKLAPTGITAKAS